MSLEHLFNYKKEDSKTEDPLPKTKDDWLNLILFVVVLSFVCRGFLWVFDKVESWLT